MRILVAIIALALAGCASGPHQRDRYARLLPPTADPGKVVATELAFARAAQDEGQWTAFREFATDDAVMFVPQVVQAQDWLKQQADPAQAVKWQPHQVWSSCDGSLAVTRGAWQRADGTNGYFTTIWQRQKNGEYKWVLDQGEPLATSLAAPDMIATTVADCGGDTATGSANVDTSDKTGGGEAQDGTLAYGWAVAPDLSRTLAVSILKDGKFTDALAITVPAPAQ